MVGLSVGNRRHQAYYIGCATHQNASYDMFLNSTKMTVCRYSCKYIEY